MSSDIIQVLTQSLVTINERLPRASLRVWFEDDGNIKFFLTNLPPRKKGRPGGTTVPTPEHVAVPAVEAADVIADEANQHPGPPETRTRTRARAAKRKKNVFSPPASSPVKSPELLRRSNAEISEIDVSSYENCREMSVSSIPISNTFQALQDLGECEDDPVEREDVGCEPEVECEPDGELILAEPEPTAHLSTATVSQSNDFPQTTSCGIPTCSKCKRELKLKIAQNRKKENGRVYFCRGTQCKRMYATLEEKNFYQCSCCEKSYICEHCKDDPTVIWSTCA